MGIFAVSLALLLLELERSHRQLRDKLLPHRRSWQREVSSILGLPSARFYWVFLVSGLTCILGAAAHALLEALFHSLHPNVGVFLRRAS